MPHAVLNCLYSPDTTLEIAVDILAQRAVELVAAGASLLILSDRAATPEAIPIPMAMAAGAVHMALTRAGVRAEVGVAAEAGDCREIHHVAVLAGNGRGRGVSVAGAGNRAQSESGKGRREPAACARTRLGQGDVEDGHQRVWTAIARRICSMRSEYLPRSWTSALPEFRRPLADLASPRLKRYVRQLWQGESAGR